MLNLLAVLAELAV